MENQNKVNSEFIDKLALKLTLKMLRTGSDSTNFDILKSLPSTTPELQDKTKLTKMPLNERINELEEVGLVRRERYIGGVHKTSLTNKFFNSHQHIKRCISDSGLDIFLRLI